MTCKKLKKGQGKEHFTNTEKKVDYIISLKKKEFKEKKHYMGENKSLYVDKDSNHNKN